MILSDSCESTITTKQVKQKGELSEIKFQEQALLRNFIVSKPLSISFTLSTQRSLWRKI